MFSSALLAVLLAALLAACVNDDGKNLGPGEPVEPKAPYGRFYVSMLAPGPWTADTQVTLVGNLADGTSPSTRVWQEEAREGDCRLITPHTPFCDPACGSGAACVEGGVCVAYPKSLDAGKVTVTGMKTQTGANTFTMNSALGTYQPKNILLANRPFAEGAAVTFTAAGAGGVPAFSVSVLGISIPSILNDSIILDGRTLGIRWTPPETPAVSAALLITLDLSHHGGLKGMIECVTEDDGEADVPGALVTQLKNLGLSGYPDVKVVRRANGVSLDHPVGAVIEGWSLKYAVIPGLVSCTGNSECPSGQTCQSDKKCQ